MNKIVVKLKQHSPFICFHPEQEGAILRASEVKPRLDKFGRQGGDYPGMAGHS